LSAAARLARRRGRTTRWVRACLAGCGAALSAAPSLADDAKSAPSDASPSAASAPPAPSASDRPSPAAAPADTVTVRSPPRLPLRGIGDLRITRAAIDAAPRANASEMLSAAPGFFVDHEDAEGLGNDVHLRGFDLEHGSGIEFRVGSIPLNVPTHIQGQGYADANFIIPEVVRGIRALEGVYDPHQGDAAIAGSAYFELGVPERGYHLKTTYGSFNQRRLSAVVAPHGELEETFVAFALRGTDGFGARRGSASASSMAQYAIDFGDGYRARLSAAAYEARTSLPGVVRRDDVDAGRIGLYDSYAGAEGQSALASRMHVGVDVEGLRPDGGRVSLGAWVAATSLRMRQNFTGALEASRIDPELAGLGDLFESVNDETAFGASASLRTRAFEPSKGLRVSIEPGAYLRSGFTSQSRGLVRPDDFTPWDRRIDADVQTSDLGAFVDADVRLLRLVHLAGGVRADALLVSVDDHLANVAALAAAGGPSGERRSAMGLAVSPRATIALEISPWLQPVASYGEGFRSLDATHLTDGSTRPYSKVRSGEVGLRARSPDQRYTTSLALFETYVANELVFEAESGGLDTQGASHRRGVVASVLAKPVDWLFGNFSASISHAEYDTEAQGGHHFVPGVPAFLLRGDASVTRPIAQIRGSPVTGRVGVGYTFAARRHVSDDVILAPTTIVNASAGARYRAVELGVDAFNLLDLRYGDEESAFISSWGTGPGPRRASEARHLTAAPPFTVVASLSLHL